MVPELNKTKCQGSQWNSTLMDGIMSDFMTAVCGQRAADGECGHSVAQQLSTMPAWMYEGGTNYSDIPVSRAATIRWHLHPSVDTSEL